jgi:hypothetical protein
MPETHPVSNPRPIGAPPYEPVVRLGTPPLPGVGASHPNHPVLLPDPDADDDLAPIPTPSVPVSAPVLTTIVAPKPHWYRGLARPSAYLASGIAGAVLVTVLYGFLGSRLATPGGRGGSESAAGAVPIADTLVLDRRADTLALAISAFTMRATMFDSRRMPCTGLARGLTQVEDAWLVYNMARKDLMAVDPTRDGRDKNLYSDVRTVEVRFERSSCARP